METRAQDGSIIFHYQWKLQYHRGRAMHWPTPKQPKTTSWAPSPMNLRPGPHSSWPITVRSSQSSRQSCHRYTHLLRSLSPCRQHLDLGRGLRTPWNEDDRLGVCVSFLPRITPDVRRISWRSRTSMANTGVNAMGTYAEKSYANLESANILWHRL